MKGFINNYKNKKIKYQNCNNLYKQKLNITNEGINLNLSYEEIPFSDDFIFSNANNYNNNLNETFNYNDKKLKNNQSTNDEIDLESNGSNIEDSSLYISSLDFQNSKMNFSLDIEKKIDELILKNLQKDSLTLKIQVDYNFNKSIILLSLIGIIYSILLLTRPFNYSNGVYSLILLFLPFSFLKICDEFKNNYLKYSSELSKTIFNFVSFYLSLCILIFISLLILKFSEFEFVNSYLTTFIYFIPIYSIILIIIFFFCFLRPGFVKLEKDNTFNFILMNLLVILTFTIIFQLKASSLIIFVKWLHLMIFASFYHGFNFLGIYCLMNDSHLKIEEFSEIKTDQSVLKIFDLLTNFCLICFYITLGLYLDNSLEKVKIISMYILSWLFFFIIIVKSCYKNRRIKNYLEWRNVVIS